MRHPREGWSETTHLVLEGSPTNVEYCNGEVSKQEDGQTDRQTCRQTDRQTAQDWVVATQTTTQISIYNSLNMVEITMYLYVERDFVIGISYTGIQWLYLIIKVRSYEVFVV